MTSVHTFRSLKMIYVTSGWILCVEIIASCSLSHMITWKVLLIRLYTCQRVVSFCLFSDGVHWRQPDVIHSWFGAQRTVRIFFLVEFPEFSYVFYALLISHSAEDVLLFFRSLPGKGWSISALADIVSPAWTAVVTARRATAGPNGMWLRPSLSGALYVSLHLSVSFRHFCYGSIIYFFSHYTIVYLLTFLLLRLAIFC